MKVIIKNLQKRIPIYPKRIKKAVLKTLLLEGVYPVRKISTSRRILSNGVKKAGEITVCFVNDKRIKELNLKYLNRDYPTDVIAFDVTGPGNSGALLADLIVSADRAVANAAVFKTYPLYELYLYVVHGTLHLLGYDDRTTKQRRIMEKKSNRILSTLKLNK